MEGLSTCILQIKFVTFLKFWCLALLGVKVVCLFQQLSRALSEGDVPKVKKGFRGFTGKPGKAAKVMARLVQSWKRGVYIKMM